jgi:hypothetical protein
MVGHLSESEDESPYIRRVGDYPGRSVLDCLRKLEDRYCPSDDVWHDAQPLLSEPALRVASSDTTGIRDLQLDEMECWCDASPGTLNLEPVSSSTLETVNGIDSQWWFLVLTRVKVCNDLDEMAPSFTWPAQAWFCGSVELHTRWTKDHACIVVLLGSQVNLPASEVLAKALFLCSKVLFEVPSGPITVQNPEWLCTRLAFIDAVRHKPSAFVESKNIPRVFGFTGMEKLLAAICGYDVFLSVAGDSVPGPSLV